MGPAIYIGYILTEAERAARRRATALVTAARERRRAAARRALRRLASVLSESPAGSLGSGLRAALRDDRGSHDAYRSYLRSLPSRERTWVMDVSLVIARHGGSQAGWEWALARAEGVPEEELAAQAGEEPRLVRAVAYGRLDYLGTEMERLGIGPSP